MDNAFGKRLKRAIKRLKPDALKVRKMLPEWNDEKVKKIADFRAEMFALGDMYSAEKGLDKVLIGSDMVFDFYEGYNPFMYGKNVNCDYILRMQHALDTLQTNCLKLMNIRMKSLRI